MAERVANLESNRRLFDQEVPLDFGYRRWQFQKVERVYRFERADRSTAGVGSKILGLFGKAVEGDFEEYTNTLPQARRTKKVRALQDSATTVN